MMYAKEEGVPVDAAALSQRVASAVVEVVRKQAESGVDIVDDGEISKPSYATYVRIAARLWRHRRHVRLAGPRRLPTLAKRVIGHRALAPQTPACNAPIGVRGTAGGPGPTSTTWRRRLPASRSKTPS